MASNHSSFPQESADASRRLQIERIAGSLTFSRSGQLQRLLRWLGERSISQPGRPPTEKEVAELVLNRRNFDPQVDSSVRKEMSRLRERLNRYYALEGVRDDIRVTADDGYKLAFDGSPAPDLKPCWLVLPFRSHPDLADQVERLLDEILIRLHENGQFELVASTTALGYRGRTGNIRQFAAECCASVVVEGTLRRQGENVEAIVWLIRADTGRCTRSTRVLSAGMDELIQRIGLFLMEKTTPSDGTQAAPADNGKLSRGAATR